MAKYKIQKNFLFSKEDEQTLKKLTKKWGLDSKAATIRTLIRSVWIASEPGDREQ